MCFLRVAVCGIVSQAADLRIVACEVDCDKGDTCRWKHRFSHHVPREMLLSNVSDKTHQHSMVPAGHQKDDNVASLLEFSTGRGYGRYPARGPSLMMSVLFYRSS